jgi:chromosome segregation ATPase
VDPYLAAALVGDAVALIGTPLTFALGRRTRAATTARDEADATESLAGSVVQLGQRLDQVTAALWDAQSRLALSESRAAAAEQRASAAELRSATSDAEVARLRGEVERLRTELARYEATGAPAAV